MASGRPLASPSATSMRRFAGGLQLHTTDLDDINLDEVDKQVAAPPPPPAVAPVSPGHPLPTSSVPLPRGPALAVPPASQVTSLCLDACASTRPLPGIPSLLHHSLGQLDLPICHTQY